MELMQLEMFVAVADSGSITKAAQAMMRAPSNLSTRIQQLERELGVALLVRDRRQASLSADGEQFLEHARQIVELAHSAKSFARLGEPHGLFRLGALESTAAVRIPELLANYHLNHRDVELELVAESSGRLVDDLLSGHLTAAFTDGAPASPQLTGIRAFTETMIVAVPPTVDVEAPEFRSSRPTAFAFGSSCSYRQRFEDWMIAVDVRPARIVEISSYYSMVACVASGAGMAMFPESLFVSLPGAARVQKVPIEGDLGLAETWLTWRRDCQSANLRALVSLLEAGLPEDPRTAIRL